jgi:hypothetical protein
MYIAVAYMIEARIWLQLENKTTTTTTFTSLVVIPKALVTFFCTLENTSQNQQLIYRVIYGFNKNCLWLGRVVDDWLLENKIVVRQMNVRKK